MSQMACWRWASKLITQPNRMPTRAKGMLCSGNTTIMCVMCDMESFFCRTNFFHPRPALSRGIMVKVPCQCDHPGRHDMLQLRQHYPMLTIECGTTTTLLPREVPRG